MDLPSVVVNIVYGHSRVLLVITFAEVIGPSTGIETKQVVGVFVGWVIIFGQL